MNRLIILSLSLLVLLGGCGPKQRLNQRILVFSKTDGFRHSSIGAGKVAIMRLGIEHGMQVDTTESPTYFIEDSLKQYSAVVFLNTTKDVLNARQQADFERYIQAGGGFVGIHAATDTEYHWPWYGQLVGAYFVSHPHTQEARLEVINKDHISTNMLPESFMHNDEWYDFNYVNEDIIPLIKIDTSSYEKGRHFGKEHYMAWYHEFDGGRSWYTNLGHRPQTFENKDFLAHLLGGIQYAIGENLELNYAKATSIRKPEDNRFVVTVLDEYLDEPGELDVMPNGNILFTQRRGELMLYEPAKRASKLIAKLDVYDAKEDGLVGLELDPNYEENNYLYLYYSDPVVEDTVFHLSRFKFVDDSLYMDSEQKILTVPVQRRECCHTGGSITFDKDGLLYLSTGDDTNPFETGYAPINGLPGRAPWDARRSSANPNDYRGKILRIKVNEDASYSIPDGNLFPKDGSQGLPEIYVMGCRNPYRVSIDMKKGYVFWGDVGPDANIDSTRGPRGHDEVNMAKKPGFFGWPLFVADNKPYQEVDFSDNSYQGLFVADAPINRSPFNTGPQNLPPAQPAMVYYPYAASKEFPLTGQGGRNAMAGPRFYHDMYAGTPSQFPKYYDEKLFIYDFSRDWVLVVTFDENDEYLQMEEFLPDLGLSSPMDMEFGPDGAMYILEYGTRWFAPNQDARLIKIDYKEGNRAPMAKLAVKQQVGAAPFTVDFSAAESFDHDGDTDFTYSWEFTDNDNTQTGADPTTSFTFEKPGVYRPRVSVTDAKGETGFAEIEIQVGNAPPQIALNFQGNKTFFWPGSAINYDLQVSDQEDGSTTAGTLSEDEVTITFDYLDGSADVTEIAQGHEAIANASLQAAGEKLIRANGCIACHGYETEIVGPAYKAVALKYKDQGDAMEYIASTISNGSSGKWGGKAMPAFPQFSKSDLQSMSAFILAQSEAKEAPKSLPLSGTLRTPNRSETGTYTFYSSYTDKGGDQIGPLSASEVITLRHPKFPVANADQNMSTAPFRNGSTIAELHNGVYFILRDVDMTGINNLVVEASGPGGTGSIELRVGSATGEKIGEVNLGETGGRSNFRNTDMSLKATQGKQDLYFVGKRAGSEEMFTRVRSLTFEK